MNTKLISFAFALTVMLSCNRCKEECDDATNPECPNYVAPVDPCAGHSEVSAAFEIYQSTEYPISNPDGAQVLTNEILTGRNVHLHALKENATSYKWLIGQDTITTQDYNFYFPTSFAGQSIPITLIVQAPIDSACFPLDNGLDTTIQYIQVIDFCDAAIFGTFRGALDSAPLDTFEIKIDQQEFPGDPTLGCPLTYLFNFVQNGDSCDADISQISNGHFEFISSTITCEGSRGQATLNTNSLTFLMEYQHGISGNPELWPIQKFRGYKIQ